MSLPSIYTTRLRFKLDTSNIEDERISDVQKKWVELKNICETINTVDTVDEDKLDSIIVKWRKQYCRIAQNELLQKSTFVTKSTDVFGCASIPEKQILFRHSSNDNDIAFIIKNTESEYKSWYFSELNHLITSFVNIASIYISDDNDNIRSFIELEY